MDRSEENLLEVLERIMASVDRAMDCNELFEIPEVRANAASANRVSDYLGNLWRKGKLMRVPVPEPGRGARWKYQWKNKITTGTTGVEYLPKLITNRPTMLISEQGDQIQIELADLTILIKQKKIEPRKK
jgi:hypothetical protein